MAYVRNLVPLLDRVSAELFQGEAECKRLHSFTLEAG